MTKWDQIPVDGVNVGRETVPSSETEGKEVKMSVNVGKFTGTNYGVKRCPIWQPPVCLLVVLN